jgi:hypothetical protein
MDDDILPLGLTSQAIGVLMPTIRSKHNVPWKLGSIPERVATNDNAGDRP